MGQNPSVVWELRKTQFTTSLWQRKGHIEKLIENLKSTVENISEIIIMKSKIIPNLLLKRLLRGRKRSRIEKLMQISNSTFKNALGVV